MKNFENWQPSKKNDKLLSRAMEFVNSVSYAVSLRWVFYRLLQEGFYSKKGDYANWVKLSSKVRKNFYKDWNPDTLTDDSRERIEKAYGDENVEDYLNRLKEYGVALGFELDHFYKQDNYVEIWFEARAMVRQFEHYTNRINLFPFGGQTSIPLKWETAKKLEICKEKYNNNIVILYFGDYDKAGFQIPESAVRDIRAWCNIDFEFIRCGLTEEQAIKYNIPENPDKPGEYQWEALSDENAGEIIIKNVSTYIDENIISKLVYQAEEVKQKLEEKLNLAISEIVDDYRESND